MNWILPGTVLEAPMENADQVEALFSPMFLAGGMMLSQVSSITGLEPYIIQNWVKRGFLAPPVNKRYTLRQLCRILNINMLKGVLPMDQICGMLEYINGQLDDESDDLIDDSRLYFIFVRMAARAKELDQTGTWLETIAQVLADYQEPVPGAKERIAKVLRIMLLAYVAARMKDDAMGLLDALPKNDPFPIPVHSGTT